MQSYTRIGTLGILALVALRIGIGWHFFMEGSTKVREGNFNAAGFLTAAKGPFAEDMQSLIWDYDGRIRLDREQVPQYFADAAKQATEHFKFDKEQVVRVDKALEQSVEDLKSTYQQWSDELVKYWDGLDRVESMESASYWNSVESLRKQRVKIEGDRITAVKPVIAQVDSIWNRFEIVLNGIANKEQLAAVGAFEFKRPGSSDFDIHFVNKALPIFDMSVGILLILGLLTPVASIAGAVFLISVVLSQMPGYPDTQPTYFQAVEALALLVVASMDAGRYAGLDFIPWAYWHRKRSSKTAPTPA